MNVVVNSDTNKKEVASKYFTKNPMDESLSDFQETKKSHSGPKSSSANIKKSRKVAKKPKGQRDIRTALKSKKNDLVAYTEKFDAVCKKVGVDVDTEDLQLAIALSKSLQTGSDYEDCPKQISSQERVKKIRTTLQEYGFKVPETKIRPIKKIKKQKKDYLLISKSIAEKAQTISDKYSQILFTNVDKLNNCNQDIEVPYFSLFNISTNILYEDIKQNNVYYIDNLVEKSSSNGCLLRDWNKIPGRPASPKLIEDSAMNFSEIECSQEELDSVLSGPLRQVKKTLSLKKNIKEKLQNVSNSNSNSKNLVENKEIPHIVIEPDEEKTTKVKVDNNVVAHRSCSPDIFDDEESVIECPSTPTIVQEKTIETMDLTECINNIVPKNQYTFIDSQMFQRNGKDVTKRKSNDFMDLTECVATSSQPIHVNIDCRENPYSKECLVKEKNESILDLTQSSNSLDSLPDIHFGNNENLEDTVILSSDDYKRVKTKNYNFGNKSNANAVYDLTQDNEIEPEGNLSVSSKTARSNITTDIEVLEDISTKVCTNIGDTNDSNQIKVDNKEPERTSNTSMLNSSSTDTNAPICDEFYLSTDKNTSKEHNVEKSHPKNSSVIKINQVHEFNENNLKDNSDLQLSNSINEERGEVFENYSFDHSMNSSNDGNRKSSQGNQECKDKRNNVDIDDGINEKEMWHRQNHVKDNDNIDLTQSSNSSIDKIDDCYGLESLPSNKDNDSPILLPVEKDQCNESSITCNSVKNNNIAKDIGELSEENNSKGTDNVDLTQSSNTSAEKMDESCHNYGSEHFSEDSNHSDKTIILEEYKYSSPGYRHSLRSKDISIDYDDVINADEYNNGINSAGSSRIETNEGTDDIQASQNTEVFEIIDNELDYSLHRSRRENFCDDDLEILDDVPCSRICESDKLDKIPLSTDTNDNEPVLKPVTPKKNNKARIIKTPENPGYIIKYDATPMPNYEAMTSPERINELEKYGLKPIKRKRAIQLLTHIYNQTHPTIESIEQMQSPSKRFKKNTTPPHTPRKILMETTRSNLDILENGWDIFEVTKETPDIKEIECAVEDWVFQKREKAKVHSCRVPLHVAFHNYVSCRRGLREAILRYEPIEIDVVHKQLVSYGHRYDPRDLLRFMDKKCITVKTNDNTRNK